MLKHSSYLRNLVLIPMFCSPFVFSSCYTYRVATQAQTGTEPSKQVVAHSFFWGLLQQPKDFIHTPVCDSLEVNGMAEVKIKSNLGYAFITVATLGIWSPVKVEFRCAKPCKKTGTL
jgi:hypothetical protein